MCSPEFFRTSTLPSPSPLQANVSLSFTPGSILQLPASAVFKMHTERHHNIAQQPEQFPQKINCKLLTHMYLYLQGVCQQFNQYFYYPIFLTGRFQYVKVELWEPLLSNVCFSIVSFQSVTDVEWSSCGVSWRWKWYLSFKQYPSAHQ